MGAADSVGLVPSADVVRLVPALVQEGTTAQVVYTGPLTAPIKAGDVLGELIIHIPDLPDARVPLVAQSDVAQGGFVKHLTTAANALRARYLDGATGS